MILILALACAARVTPSPPATPTVTARVESWTRGGEPMKSDQEILVSWPVVEGPGPAINATLAQVLSPEGVFGERRAEIEAAGWADEISYTLDWQGPGLLGLTITLQASVAAERASLSPEDDVGPLLDDHAARPEDLRDYGLRLSGVLFVHDFGSHHVALALEPDGQMLVSWAEIGPFLSADCALRRALASASP